MEPDYPELLLEKIYQLEELFLDGYISVEIFSEKKQKLIENELGDTKKDISSKSQHEEEHKETKSKIEIQENIHTVISPKLENKPHEHPPKIEHHKEEKIEKEEKKKISPIEVLIIPENDEQDETRPEEKKI